jgi:hypothetical protein
VWKGKLGFRIGKLFNKSGGNVKINVGKKSVGNVKNKSWKE